ALLGAALGMTGVLMGQMMPLVERYAVYLERARWSPSGAAAYALAYGLRAGGAGAFAWSFAVLSAYAAACVALSYQIARRTALGKGGGARRAATAAAEESEKDENYAGWRLPFVSSEFSAVV